MDHSLDQEIISPPDHAESSPADLVSPPTGGRSQALWVWAICGFLLLLVGLVFGQMLHHEFLDFDDDVFVYKNPHVTPGLTLSGLWWALTDGTVGEWYPLSALSDMLDCQLYGLKPAGHFLTNVLLHAASSVLLFLVLLRMTRELWPSAWVAAVFAVHPLHVESVAWLAERRDVLSGLFFMLTLGAYALYAERPSIGAYLAVAGMFALGLMSKPMLVTVPFVLLLLDDWPLARFRAAAGSGLPAESRSWLGGLPIGWRLIVEKIPLMALAAVSSAIALSTHMSLKSTNPVERLSLATRVANALVSYAAYVGQSFYPAGLAAYYPHLANRIPIAWAAGSLVLLVAISALAAYFWRRRPYLLVGWLWFLGMLVPVIGLVPVAAHSRADRYVYLSQIGLSIALAWCVWAFYQSRQAIDAARWRQWTLVVASAATMLVLATVAWRQTSYWRNAETLWTHTIACTGPNAMARHNLGYALAKQGKFEEAIAQLREAVAADSIDPASIAKAHGLLADCLTRLGKADEALAQYEQAVRVLPAAPMFHAQLATALARAGQLDRAIDESREAIRLSPSYASAHLGLANALYARGDASQAAAECREVLREEPDSIEALVVLGAALVAEGKGDEAISPLERALQLDPHNAPAHASLGLALHDQGQSRSALDHLNEAMRLWPSSVPMLWQTAWILATSPDASVRDGKEAMRLAARAVQLSAGQDVRALDSLAAALAETGQFAAAVDAAGQASTLALLHSDNALADAIEQRTRLYRQGQPYRQPTPSLPAGHAPSAE